MRYSFIPAQWLRNGAILFIYCIYCMQTGYSQAGFDIPALKERLTALKKTDLPSAESLCSEEMKNAAPPLRAYLQFNRGMIRIALQKQQEARQDLEAALRWATSNPGDTLQAYVLAGKGIWWQINGQSDSAAVCFEAALETIQPGSYWTIRADCLELSGILYLTKHQFSKAAEALRAACQIGVDHKDDVRQCRLNMALGDLQQLLFESDKAYESFLNAQKAALRTNDKGLHAVVLVKLGDLALELAQTQKDKSKYWLNKSINYYQVALAHEQTIGRKNLLGVIVPHKARALLLLEGPDKAMYLLNLYAPELENNDNTYDLSEYWHTLALVYHARKDEAKSKQAAMRFLEKKPNEHSKEKLEILNILADINRKQGDFQKADGYMIQALSETQTLQALRDSSLKNQLSAQVVDMEAMLKMDSQQQRIQYEKKRADMLFSILLGIGTLLIAGSGLMLSTIISKNKLNRYARTIEEDNRTLFEQKRKIEQLFESKNQLFSQITDDIRTPLTLSKIPAEILESNYAKELSSGARYLLQSILLNLNRLQDISQEIAHLSEPETLAPGLRNLSLSDFAAEIRHSFALFAQTKNIHFSYNLQLENDTDVLPIDRSITEKTVLTLLLNAFKTTNSGGKITLEIRTQRLPDHTVSLEFAVRNDHAGSPEGRPDNDQSVSVKPSGLLIAGELAKRMNGRLESSILPGGNALTTLQLRCQPETLQHLEEGALPQGATPLETSRQYDRPVLYLIEDDADTATMLTTGLQYSFKVLHFENAESFLLYLTDSREKADLVIIDVKLPDTSGIQALRAIRKNPAIRMLPLIVVSGSNLSTTRNIAYQEGADDYIVKPFQVQELIPRIHNLMLRERLLQAASTVSEQPPASAEIYRQMKETILSNTPDTKKDWVSRVLEIIEQNLSNPNLDVAMLARELAVSDRQLFRFLKKYTGFSPNQLMHETRLCMAYHLLASNPAIPIAQVSLQVGFDNSGYFSVVFKKRFGINPSELRNFEET